MHERRAINQAAGSSSGLSEIQPRAQPAFASPEYLVSATSSRSCRCCNPSITSIFSLLPPHSSFALGCAPIADGSLPSAPSASPTRGCSTATVPGNPQYSWPAELCSTAEAHPANSPANTVCAIEALGLAARLLHARAFEAAAGRGAGSVAAQVTALACGNSVSV